jgi:[ribosomal protein S5]-alanine N-acetyltransferase
VASRGMTQRDDAAAPRPGTSGAPAQSAAGGRVYLRAPERSDRGEFVALMRASRAFHRPWATAPTDDEAFDAYVLDSRRPDFEAMLVCRREDHAILGFFNLSHITRGSLQSAYLGYAVASAYAGQGYMCEGIELVLREAFLTLRLHRIEANIQPGNQASIALASGAGFSREGFSPRYLKIGGRWRDHERWAILADDWRVRAEKLGLSTLP